MWFLAVKFIVTLKVSRYHVISSSLELNPSKANCLPALSSEKFGLMLSTYFLYIDLGIEVHTYKIY